MPIYAYRCSACGHTRDVLQKLSDPVLTTCTACGAQAFTKQLTAAGFQLKGSGWYVTDFRDGGAKPKDKPQDGQSSTAGDGAATTGDAAAPAAPGAASGTTGSSSAATEPGKSAGATSTPSSTTTAAAPAKPTAGPSSTGS